MSGPDCHWVDATASVRALRCPALDGQGVIHGFAVRQPGVDVQTEREEAVARLAPAHAALRGELHLANRLFVTAEQVHGCGVAAVGAGSLPIQAAADALITNEPGVCLGIYVADCCAVFLVDPVKQVIGLVHSGAKGTRLGITSTAIAQMREVYGSLAGDVIALLSPCIRPPHYEVDFAAEIRRQCAGCGVTKVLDPGDCTAADLGRFYSYRMEKGKTGRMLAVLALAAP